jgi:hypothetical protein
MKQGKIIYLHGHLQWAQCKDKVALLHLWEANHLEAQNKEDLEKIIFEKLNWTQIDIKKAMAKMIFNL